MEVIMTTKEDLLALAKEAANLVLNERGLKEPTMETPKAEPNLIRGIQGLAEFLGVSNVTAIRMKNKKLFPYMQHGRVLLFKPDEVLDGLAQKGKRMQPKKDEQVDDKDPCVCAIDPDSLMEYVCRKSEQTIGILKRQGLFNKEHLALLCQKAFVFGIAVSHHTESELKKHNGNLYPFNDYIK